MSAEESVASLQPELDSPPDDTDNSDTRWRREYEKLIRKMGLSEAPPPVPGADRRQYPRVSLPTGASIFAHGSPEEFKLHDLSAGGVCFFSDHHIEPKARLILSAMGLLALEVDVVGCEVEVAAANVWDITHPLTFSFFP